MNILNAQPNNYSNIDVHAMSTNNKLIYSIDKLAKYLSEPAENDFEKVRSFWVRSLALNAARSASSSLF